MSKGKIKLAALLEIEAELAENLEMVTNEIHRIAQGKKSQYTSSHLHKVRDNYKLRLRGVRAAIRNMGPTKTLPNKAPKQDGK